MKISKRILSVFLALGIVSSMFSLLTFGVSAAMPTSGTTGDCTWVLDGTKLTVSGNGKMGDNTVPWGTDVKTAVIESGVTNIGKYVFYHCAALESITIPDSVVSIGDNAFGYCTGLESITIPKGVTDIGDYAFSHCEKLESITIPDNVTSIGYYAFEYCNNLKSITVPDSVTSIGIDAFNSTAYYNNSANWENGVLYIGNHLVAADENTVSGKCTVKGGTLTVADEAFYYCASLESITIPDGVKSIGDYAFEHCEKLKSVTLPDSVTSIGESAFEYCKKLEGITVPKGVTSIRDFTFSYCDCLKKVTIPAGVTSIGFKAFAYCSSLESVTIPNSVKSIDDKAFEYCGKLKSVTIPSSVTSIGYRVFEDCSDNLVIYGKIGSYPKKYADNYDIKFVDKNHTCKSFKTTTAKATFSKNGKTVKTCKACGKATSTTIYKVSSVKLSATAYAYNGKAKKPTVTVKTSNGKTLKNGTDYTVTYSNNKYVGKASVKVTLKGNYSGTKTVTFKINPKSTALKSLTAGKKQITAKWNKQATQTSGYQIQYSTSSAFKNAKTVTVTGNKTTSKIVKNLSGGKKYYVRVRTYKTVKNTKYYSAWSAKKSATAKKK